MDKVGLSFRPEVPLHRGRAAHLAALLAGDAAQFEALPCHSLGVRVHFCAGSVATEHCQRKTTQRLQPHRWFEHVHRWTVLRLKHSCQQEVPKPGQLSGQSSLVPGLQNFWLVQNKNDKFLTGKKKAKLTKQRAEQRHQQQLHRHRLTGTFYASETTNFRPESGPNYRLTERAGGRVTTDL